MTKKLSIPKISSKERRDNCVALDQTSVLASAMHFAVPLVWIGFSAALGVLASCTPCEPVGCDIVEDPVASPSISTGIAGAAVGLGRATNGCLECPLGHGSLEVWSTSLPISIDQQAMDTIDAGPADISIDFDGRYEHTLDPGNYLVCDVRNKAVCAALHVEEGNVFTVHVHSQAGPIRLAVFAPSGDKVEEGLFELDRVE